MKHRILILEFMSPASVDFLSKKYDVVYIPDFNKNKEITKSITEASVLIVRNVTQVNRSFLQEFPQVKIIGRLGVGLDNIDVSYCEEKAIDVITAKGANDRSVAEYVITTAMMMLRKAYAVNDSVIGGKWPRQESIGCEIHGKGMALLGFGGIARLVADLSLKLGMKVFAYDPYDFQPMPNVVKIDSFDELIELADILSLHIPLTDDNRNLIGREVFKKMKKSAILINTARGGIVNEDDLIDALTHHEISGCVLDVFASEPLDDRSGAVFKDVPNLLLTPHIAGVTNESNIRVSDTIAEQVDDVLNKKYR